MARGRTSEARACYDRALQVARASHLRDTGAVMIAEALAAELEFERTAGPPRLERPRVSPRLLGECTAWLDIYAASIGVGAEVELMRGGPRAALALVEDAREYARRTDRPALIRFLSALRVWALLAGDEVEEAERAWRFDRLAEGAADCTDPNSQSWREAEMLACARLRLLIAGDEFEAARELSAALQAVAAERDLVRTRMRGLALAMVLEHRAGDNDRAKSHLVDYLGLYIEADYARPLARERAVALSLLDAIAVDLEGDGAVREGAGGLGETLRTGEEASHVPLSRGEMDVLALLEGNTDQEIAWTLNMSYEGVRSRIRRIFAKLGARQRIDAVHCARALGILPPAGDTPRRSRSRPTGSRSLKTT